MTAMTIFYQQCPVCGRTLRIPAKYFGRQMTCTHCNGEFRAGKLREDEEEMSESPHSPGEELGAMAARSFAQPQLGEV